MYIYSLGYAHILRGRMLGFVVEAGQVQCNLLKNAINIGNFEDVEWQNTRFASFFLLFNYVIFMYVYAVIMSILI